jgi:O-acetyl-ADP-ribose deacetylase (regulator of RNase III)
VTGALVEAAGPKFRSECTEFIRRHGRIANTECGITGVGQLPAYFVVHVVSFRATTGTRDEETSDAMLTTYLNLFSAIGELLTSAQWQCLLLGPIVITVYLLR